MLSNLYKKDKRQGNFLFFIFLHQSFKDALKYPGEKGLHAFPDSELTVGLLMILDAFPMSLKVEGLTDCRA